MRRANIITLDNIVMTHGATFMLPDAADEEDIWRYAVEDVLLGMLEQALNRLELSNQQNFNS